MPNRDITIAELPATTVADDNSYIPIDNGDITCKIKVSDYNAGANATARAYAEAAGTSANSASANAGSAATYASNASQSAQDASNSANTALNHANNASLYANNAYEYAAAASTSASNATSQAQQVSDYAREAGEKSEDAEAFALGQRKGVDVDSEDTTYQNNAKYYAQQAANSKSSSETAASSSLTNARIAEGYANGKQNGSAVPSGSEYYHNNAEYYAEVASGRASAAESSASRAESAVVKAPYIGANNHWYAYDFGRNEYVDTNVKASGDKGDPGTPGSPGVDGVTPNISVDASVDGTNGTPSVLVTKTGTNAAPRFSFAFSGLKGADGQSGGSSYDDTELRAEIDDIWKVQGELGAKNLIPYPYYSGASITNNGITFTCDEDGAVTVSGTSTGTSQYFFFYNIPLFLPKGRYIFSISENIPTQLTSCQLLIGGTTLAQLQRNTMEQTFEITENMAGNIQCKIIVLNGVTIDNFIIRPMIRLASDTDTIWQPYAATNKELTDKQNELAAIAGEYLYKYPNRNVKYYYASIGATAVQFDVASFKTKYGITSNSELNFDISAETTSGNVVAYNNVTVSSSGVVTITFDELTEGANFICKCSKII